MATAAHYDLGPHTFPRGWFIVAEGNELDEGPMAIRFFGQDFALYRTEGGRPVMLDPYCPHNQTHITASKNAVIVKEGGQIKGDSIRCPYHGWRFGPDGKCNDIPYHDGSIPKKAYLNSYPVEDVMGCVMMCYDPEGRPPDYPAPKLPERDDPSWVRYESDHLGELEVHPQEILDDMADVRPWIPLKVAFDEIREQLPQARGDRSGARGPAVGAPPPCAAPLSPVLM